MDLFQSQQFKTRVKSLQDKYHVPGMAMALVLGEEVSSAGFGNASLDPPKPCLPDTLFDIASCSKSFTAASVELLVQNDDAFPEVKYEALMSTLLKDDFAMSDPTYTEQVTLDDIVCHRSGMGRHDFSYMGPRSKYIDTARSVTRNLRNLDIDAPIRTKEIYNNMMYTVMAYLVEVKAKKPFAEFLEETFFRPLGMNSTRLHASNARKAGLGERIATGYAWPNAQKGYHIITAMDQPEAIGAGNIITSANDGILWIKAMMEHNGPIITKDMFDGIVRPRTIVESVSKYPFTSPALYCSGWGSSYYRGHRIIEHDGGDFGFGSNHFFVPELKFGGVMYANSNAINSYSATLMHELIDEVLGIPKEHRPDWAEYGSDDEDDENGAGGADQQEEKEAKKRKALQKIYPDIKEPSHQQKPLESYTGVYHNVGYHNMTVEIKEGRLFIDASERSMGFYLTFDHVSDQEKYIAWYSDYWEGGWEPTRAEFDFGKDGGGEDNDSGQAQRMGINLYTEKLIWFERTEQTLPFR